MCHPEAIREGWLKNLNARCNAQIRHQQKSSTNGLFTDY